jgi:hypothetical protein
MNPGSFNATTIGSNGLIPSDVVLDMDAVTINECLRSLFSLKAGNTARKGDNRNRAPFKKDFPIKDKNFNPQNGNIREYSTSKTYEAYFSRFVCLEHVRMVLL